MNWFLIIVAIVMTVMLMIGSLYVLVYFQAEEDKNTAWAPKIAVVLGLTLACCVVLLLPMDVANRSTGSGLDMEGLYQAVYMIIAIMILGVLPYLIFYYEAENPEGRNYQCWTAVKYEALTVLISLTVVVIMWVFLGKADAHRVRLQLDRVGALVRRRARAAERRRQLRVARRVRAAG